MSRRAAPYLLFAAGFVLFRAALFATTPTADFPIYKDYADTVREAGSVAALYRTRDVEYPQLAVVVAAVAGTVGDLLPESPTRLRSLRAFPPLGGDGPRFEAGLGVVLFAADVWCLLLIHGLARQAYPHEGPAARLARLAAYALFTGVLGPILFDRLDLVVGLFAVLAVCAFANARPAVAYAVLALGTGYKLVPAVLLPVFVLATAAARTGPAAPAGRYLWAVLREAVIAGLIFALWPLLTYWLGGGDRAFSFLTPHAERGLELGSSPAWAVLLADPATVVGYAHHSFTLRGRLADRVAGLCSLALLLGAAAALVVSAGAFRRHAPGPAPPGKAWKAFAPLVPQLVAASLLVWLTVILTSKVGSPQYYLWVAPLVPLLPLRSRAERAWAALLLVPMALAIVLFPFAAGHFAGTQFTADPPTWTGPTTLGLFLLAAKSVTLAVVTCWLARRLHPSPEPSA
jgi:hypothetical protein